MRAVVLMRERRIDSFAITHGPNILYLSGFSGSSGALAVAGDKWVLFTDGRYREQAHQEVHGLRVVITKGAALAAAAAFIARSGVRNVAIEADHVSVSTAAGFARQIGKVAVRKTGGSVESLRLLKDQDEIKRIRAAVDVGSALLDTALRAIKPGVKETVVAAEIEYRARQAGAMGMSFETIVASGARSALPHARALNEPIPRKGFIVMDFGVILAHYCSDMTRTVHVGRPSPADRDLYAAVLDAQLSAIAAVKPGVAIGKVDDAARTVLKRARLAKHFTHSTGHGVGLEIHESPRIAAGVKDLLQPGMVVTIEPGVYIPGRGGVRIEDVVLVTETGCQVLTRAPKELVVI